MTQRATERVLPPEVSEQGFVQALQALRSVVGDQWVLSDEAELARYLDPYPVVEEGIFVPSASVLPDRVEQVQAIVRIANEFRIPLSPISTGNNNSYGGAAPRCKGAIIVDLKRLNRILEVDETLCYALVEPGVSYQALYDHLQQQDSHLWIDVPDLCWGSVVGNTLERGGGYTPYGDHFMMQCGMEVVLPDGGLLRTGMGALPGSTTWQSFAYGYGPSIDGLFTQSNFGIVTKMGVWLMPRPPGYQAYMVTVPREQDLEQLVEIVRSLRFAQIIQNTPTIRHILLDAAAIHPKEYYYSGPGPVPGGVIEQIQQNLDLGFWNLYGAMYGSPSLLAATWLEIQHAFQDIPGVRFYKPEDRPDRGGRVLADREKIMRGEPSLEELKILNWVPNGGHVDFSPVLPMTGRDAVRVYEMIRDRLAEHGLDYQATFIVGGRELHHITLMIFEHSSPRERRNVRALYEALVRDAAAAGYGVYRTHLAFMNLIASTYSWNNHAQMRFFETIKDALDPNGVFAPGKQGIWPKRLRGQGQASSEG